MNERDQWGFQPQCYLERSSFHGQNPDDPWLKFRLPNGEFKFWLHTWCYVTDPPGQKYRGRGVMLGRPFAPLPWVFEVPPDGAFLSALRATGFTKKMPANWASFEPPAPAEMFSWVNGRMYGAVFSGFNQDWVPRYLATLRKQFMTQQDFYGCLGSRHTLYSRNRS